MKLGWIDWELMRYARQLKRDQHTFLSYLQLASLAESFVRLRGLTALRSGLPSLGWAVDGSAMLLAWMVNRYGGSLDLYDIFARIPAPSTEDGQEAQSRYQNIWSGKTAITTAISPSC